MPFTVVDENSPLIYKKETTGSGDAKKTTWYITYPSEGAAVGDVIPGTITDENPSGNTVTPELGALAPMQIETDPKPSTTADGKTINPHGQNHVDRLFWFVSEDTIGWALEEYSNENAEASGVVSDDYYKSANWYADSTADTSDAQKEIAKAEDSAFMSVFRNGGEIINTPAVIIKAQKIWDDDDDTHRQDIIMHLDAEVTKDGTTVSRDDVLPPQLVVKSGNNRIVVWGDKDDYPYTPVDSSSVWQSSSQMPQGSPTNPIIYERGNASMLDFAYYASDGSVHYVNELPATDDNGNPITYTIRETLVDGSSVEETDATKGLERYITEYQNPANQLSNLTRINKVGVKVYTGPVTNEIEPIGLVGFKVDKILNGRVYKSDDQFEFVLSGENDAPMPVKTPIDDRVVYAKDRNKPEKVTAAADLADGTVRATADFGAIAYTRDDLGATEVTYGATGADALTDAEKAAVRYWTAEVAKVQKTNKDGAPLYNDGSVEGTIYEDDGAGGKYPPILIDAPAGTMRTFDMRDDDQKKAFFDTDSATAVLSDDGRNAATGTLYEREFTYKVAETAIDSAADGDTAPVANDTTIREIKLNVLYDAVARKMLVSAKQDGANWVTGADATVAINDTDAHTTPKVYVEPVFFTNTYTSEGSWGPSALKVLNGRPLERDQFTFKIGALNTIADGQVEVAGKDTPLPTENTSQKKAQGDDQYWNRDGSAYVQNSTSSDDAAMAAGDTLQDVKAAESGEDKGTQGLNGPVSFGDISYTQDDLKKTVIYNDDPTDAQKAEGIRKATGDAERAKVASWEWTDEESGKTYVWGSIPDDATAKIQVDGLPVPAESITYADATDAQRRAAQGRTLDTLWTKDGKYYVAPTYKADGTVDTDARDAIVGKKALGSFYLAERVFSYEMWEDISEELWEKVRANDNAMTTYKMATDEDKNTKSFSYNGYIYDTKIRTVEVTAKDKGDGTIEIAKVVLVKRGTDEVNKTVYDAESGAGSLDDPVDTFKNTYKAVGEVQISLTKKMDGRDEFGRESFTGKDKFTFEISAVTSGAPLPSANSMRPGQLNTTGDAVKRADMETSNETPETGKTAWTFYFDRIAFTHEDLMGTGDAANDYIATRTADDPGVYQRTFVYKITEKSPSGYKETGTGQGVDPDDNKDTRNSLFVAVTVQEDNEGNIKVVAVNGADAAELGKDVFKNQGISIGTYTAGTWDYKAQAMSPQPANVAQNAVGAGTIYNTYQASGKTNKIEVTKTLNGRLTLKDKMFWAELVLMDKNGAKEIRVVDTKSNADGKFSFDEIVYNEYQMRKDAEASPAVCEGPNTESEEKLEKSEWIYTYMVRELIPGDELIVDGVSYDTTELTFKVKVADKGDGTLSFKYSVDGGATWKDKLADDDLEFTNEAHLIDLKVIKNWDDAALQALAAKGYDRPKSVAVTVAGSDGSTYGSAALTEAKGWAYTFEKLPMYKYTKGADGTVTKTAITYTVTETTPDGYTVTYTYKGTETTDKATVPAEDAANAEGTPLEVEVKNTPVVADLVKADLVLHKIDKVTNKNISGVTFELTGPGLAEAKTYMTDDYGVAHINFEQPIAAADKKAAGETYEYTLKEKTPATGYEENTDEYKISVTVSADGVKKIEVKNSNKNVFEQLFELLVSDRKNAEYDDDQRILTVKNTPTKHKFTIEKTFVDADGNAIDVSLLSGFAIKGSYTGVKDDGTAGTKKLDLKVADGTPSNGGKTYTWTINDAFYGTDVHVHETGYINVTGYDFDKTEASTEVSGSTTHDDDVNFTVPNNDDAKATFKNTYKKQTGDLELTKNWDDDANRDGKRPTTVSFMVTATADGAAANVFDNGTSSTTTVTVSGDADAASWTDVSLTKLPLYYNGKKVTYTVDEGAVTDYTKTIDQASGVQLKQDACTELSITNKYTPKTGSITVTKHWEDDDNKAGMRKEASVYLYADGKLVGEVTEGTVNTTDTDQNNVITWSDLPVYTESGTDEDTKIVYTVKETAVAGYDAPAYSPTSVELADDGSEQTIAITNKFDPTYAGLTVSKVWDDANDQDGYRPSELTVDVKAEYADGTGDALVFDNGTSTTTTVTLKASENWSYSFGTEDLPKVHDGKAVVYSVDGSNEDFTQGGDKTKYTHTCVERVSASEWKITNVHTPETTDIEVEKVWTGKDDKGVRPDHVTFTLLADDAVAVDQAGNKVEPITVTKDARWKGTFRNLPIYKNGTKIAYSIDEIEIEGYKTSVEGNVADGFTVTNEYEGKPKGIKVDLPDVTKTLHVPEGSTRTLEEGEFDFCAVYLVADAAVELAGGNDAAYAEAAAAVTFEGAPLTFTVDDLLNKNGSYDEKRSFIFTFYEKPGDDDHMLYDGNVYTRVLTLTWDKDTNELSAAWDDDSTVAFENTYEPDGVSSSVTDDIAITKEVDDADHQGRTPRENEFLFQLEYTSDEGSISALATNDENGKVTFPNMFFTEIGDYTFTLIELSGYDPTIEEYDGTEYTIVAHVTQPAGEDGLSVTWTCDDEEELVFTNATVRSTKAVQARATWDGADWDAPADTTLERRPESVTVKMQQQIDDPDNPGSKIWVDVLDDEGKPRTGVLSAENNWATAFDGMPVYDADGKEIAYQVVPADESEYPGYASDVVSPTNTRYVSGSVIKFVYEVTDSTVTFTGTKTWVDGGIAHDNPNEVSLVVTVAGETTPLQEGEDYHLDWDGNTYTVRGLESDREYEIAEQQVDGYDAPEKDGNDFTNTITQVKRDISVTKAWVGAASEPVTVQLVADGVPTDSTLVLENGETKSFTGLDTYALAADAENRGHEIVYTIQELEGAGAAYHALVTGNAQDGFTVTNAFDETTIPVVKAWDDNGDQDGIRPGSVTVHLQLVDGSDATDLYGNDVPALELTEDGSWAGVFRDVPRTDDADEVIEYKVVEDEVEGYESAVSGNAQDGFTVTNTHATEKTAVSATKVWNDEGGGSTDLHTAVTLHLYGTYDGKVVYDAGTKTIAKDSTEAATWTDLPRYHYANEALQWQIVEDAVFGYATTYQWTGNECVVTNTFAGPVTEITVDKRWEDGDDVDSMRPDSVTYELLRKVGGGEPVVVDTQTVDVAEDGFASYTWRELAATVLDGGEEVAVLYSVNEQALDAALGYDDPVVEATTPGSFTAVNARQADTTSITVRKTWADGGDADGMRPDHISVTILADGEECLTDTITADDATSADVWEKTYEGLRRNASKGKAVAYTVKEGDVDGYGAAYDTEGSTLSIVNSRFATVRGLEVTKVWKDAEGNVLPAAPAAATFHLIKVVEGTGPVRVDGQDKTIEAGAAGDALKLAWSGLPGMEGGKSVTYTVEEDPVEGYTTSMGDGTVDGAQINVEVTNTQNPGPETIVVRYTDPATGTEYVREVIVRGSDEPAQPDNPTRDGHTFAGWKRTVDPATGDVTYEAQWVPVPQPGQHSVTYVDGQGNTITTAVIDDDAAEPAQPADPTRDGYTFGGWTRSTDADGNVVYTAQWVRNPETPDPTPVEVNKPRVIYVDPKAADGKTILSAKLYDTQAGADAAAAGKTDAPADPSHEGYEFVGWLLDQDEFGDWVLVAKYNEVQPESKAKTVSYIDMRNGEPMLVTVTTDDPDSVRPPEDIALTQDGLTFVGWGRMEDADGNIIYVAKFASDCANADPVNPTPSVTPSATAASPATVVQSRTPSSAVVTGTSAAGTPVASTPKTSDAAPVALLAAMAATSAALMAASSRKRIAVPTRATRGSHAK